MTSNHQLSSTRHQALCALLQAVKNSGYTFTTITPLSHATVNARPGNEWAKKRETGSAHGVLHDIFGWSRAFLQTDIAPQLFNLMQQADVLQQFDHGWRSTVRISTVRHPIFGNHHFLHSAYPSSAEHAVFFGPDTYRYLHEIDSAVIVRFKDKQPIKRAVDIGAGAGPGAVLLALHYPQADIHASDINPHALELTAVNAEVAGAHNVIALHSDLLKDIQGQFDLIASNPPYLIDADKRAYRHGGDDDGADLSYAIVEQSIPRLNPDGSLLLYTGVAIRDAVDAFHNRVEQHLRTLPQRMQWSYREIDPDIFGDELLKQPYVTADRIAAVLLQVHMHAPQNTGPQK